MGVTSDKSLAMVSSRFGDRSNLVEKNFWQNEEFRSLCEDYYACEKALETWKGSDADVAKQRRLEYAQWHAELEQEIREWLEAIDVTGH